MALKKSQLYSSRGQQRVDYGKRVVEGLSEVLTQEFGKGWGTRQLRHCLRVAETFPDRQIVNTLCSHLSWSHFRRLASNLQVLRQEGRVNADLAFRDPYVLDFLVLADTYTEHDLESAILAETSLA